MFFKLGHVTNLTLVSKHIQFDAEMI